jgi:hypothetical protein
MTTPIDPVERRLPEALTDLASPRTPDYFTDILGQTARVRQRPAWVRPGRWFGVNGFVGRPAFVAVVVVLVAVIGGGIFLSQRNQSNIGGPVGSPSAAPPSVAPSAASSSSRAPGAPLPADLQFSWMGPSRTIEGLGSWTRTQIVFKNGLMYVTGTQVGTYLTSDVDTSAGTMRLTLRQDEAGCHAGDVGDYTWSLAPAKATLTLAASSDPCAARTAAFAGTWFRQHCTNTEDGCLGDLDAGVHASQYIVPRRAVGGPWQPTWGAVTYTVPAGWANSQDWPNEFSLTPSADYAKETADGPAIGAYHEIWLFTHPSANKVTPSCDRSVDTTVKPTVDGLLAWIAKDPAITATTPTAITIDGHPGKLVDIELRSTWKTTCAGGTGGPERAFFAYPSAADNDAWMADISGKERDRVILFDLDGTTVGIMLDSGDPARFDDLVSQAMPIVQSFKFQ